MSELQVLFYLISVGSISIFIALFFVLFINYYIKYHPRLARKITKNFALLPVTLSSGRTIWLKTYFQYQEYGAGMVLGGSIRQETYGKKITWSGSGSFIPSYTTYFIGLSYMGLRQYLRSQGWESKKTKRIKKENNLKNLEKFFGPELMEKWKNGTI